MFTIYTKESCPWCVKAKELLASQNLEYNAGTELMDNVINIVKQETGKEIATRTYPQIIFNHSTYVGGYEALEDFLVENNMVA